VNNEKFTKDFMKSSLYPFAIAEFLIRHYPDMSYDWHKFYDAEVCKVAVAWCEQNHIRYKIV
jgi:hypothetical protein